MVKKKKTVRKASGVRRKGKKASGGTNLPVRYDYPYLPASDEALIHYIHKISEFPFLTEDEEKKLVEDFRKNKNVDAARELIQSNLRMVVKISLEYRNAYQNLMDIIQEGNIGLMKAVQMYDPAKGARLSHYATWWIRSYILKYIMDNFRLVKVGTTQAQKRLFFNLVRERQKIEAMGFKPHETRKLLAEKFDVPEKQIDEMSGRLQRSEASLNVPTHESDGEKDVFLIDMIEDKTPSPLDKILDDERRAQLIDRLKEFSKTLSKKEQLILKKRMLSEIPKTLQELGDEFGVTKERVRQLEERLKQRLKEVLSDLNLPPSS